MTSRRNTKTIGFNEEEYKEILKVAKKMRVYPRQAVMLKIKT